MAEDDALQFYRQRRYTAMTQSPRNLEADIQRMLKVVAPLALRTFDEVGSQGLTAVGSAGAVQGTGEIVSIVDVPGITVAAHLRADQRVTDARLWSDLNRAVRETGIKVMVTSAHRTGADNSGNPSGRRSRHIRKKAMDIAPVGFGAKYSAGFMRAGDTLKEWFVAHGYYWTGNPRSEYGNGVRGNTTYNSEGGPSSGAAVLWRTWTGGNHFHHLHISVP